MNPEPETVLLELNIQRQTNGTAFYVMQTPLPLWNALPQKAKRLDADYSHVHYSKTFVFNVRGRRYEFAFYRSERRP